jgi:hypothetical protein
MNDIIIFLTLCKCYIIYNFLRHYISNRFCDVKDKSPFTSMWPT